MDTSFGGRSEHVKSETLQKQNHLKGPAICCLVDERMDHRFGTGASRGGVGRAASRGLLGPGWPSPGRRRGGRGGGELWGTGLRAHLQIGRGMDHTYPTLEDGCPTRPQSSIISHVGACRGCPPSTRLVVPLVGPG